MKTIHTFFIYIVAFCIHLQAQTANHHHIFTIPTTTTKVVLKLEGKIEILPTNGSRIMVETFIETDIDHPQMLSSLIHAGRYNIDMEESPIPHQVIIKSQQRTNVLVVRGKACKEIINYVLYLPANMEIAVEEISSND